MITQKLRFMVNDNIVQLEKSIVLLIRAFEPTVKRRVIFVISMKVVFRKILSKHKKLMVMKKFGQVLWGLSFSYFIGTISTVRSEIDNLLRAKKVVVISLSYCPYCITAKQVLAKTGKVQDAAKVFEQFLK